MIPDRFSSKKKLGSAMLFGVVAAYFIDDVSERGDPVRLFTGVGILFIAVILNTIATRYF